MKVEKFRVENQTGGTRSCASLPVAEDCDPPKSELVAADCDPPKSEPVAAVAEDCDPPKQTSPQNCAQGCAQVMHKERGKEKENLPPTPPIREKEDLPPSHLASLHTARARGGMRSANLRRGARLRSEGQARIRCRCVLGLLRDSRLDGSRFPRLQLAGAHARMGAQTGPLEARRAEARGSGG